jgi:hypothetical protein
MVPARAALEAWARALATVASIVAPLSIVLWVCLGRSKRERAHGGQHGGGQSRSEALRHDLTRSPDYFTL